MNDNERRNLREALFAWRGKLVEMDLVSLDRSYYELVLRRHTAVVNA